MSGEAVGDSANSSASYRNSQNVILKFYTKNWETSCPVLHAKTVSNDDNNYFF